MKKRIAVFANGWSAENLRYYMETLIERLGGVSADLYIYMGHDAYGMQNNESECSIYELPDVDIFDAVVFFSPGMDFAHINDRIISHCRQSGVVLICVGKVLEGVPSIYTDQYKGMKPLVDHMIEKHHVQKILYIAGPRDNFDSNERLRALTDSCREHGVPFSGSDVFYSDWNVMAATQYIREMIKKKKKLPDAIMCANDNTAFYISFVLEEKGIDVPGEVLMSGFDGTYKAKTFYPSLTTVTQPFAKMGTRTGDCLLSVFEGKALEEKYYIPCEFSIGESCGCDVTAERDILRREVCRKMPSDIARAGFRQGRLHYMEYAVMQSERYSTLGESLQDFLYENDGQEGNPFFMFIDPALGRLGECSIEEMPKHTISEKLDMLVGKFGDVHYETMSLNVKKNPLPDLPDDGKNHMFVFMPLFVHSFVCGYMVMSDNMVNFEKTHYETFHSAMNNNLETYVKNLKLSALNDKLSDLLNKDPMTGVRNRVAYESYMLSLKDRIVSGDNAQTAFIMFDLNDLKTINDTFGHEKGDEYIKNGCRLICETFAHSIVFRIGGDEFVAVLWGSDFRNKEKLLADFRQLLSEIEAGDGAPEEKVSIASGMAVYSSENGESVDEALRRADDAMYEDKRRSKQLRGD
ncbi:MAG: GGDEF domain-containing protein [Lachnospiraceae bacterium]|nr:GGDEF domain-containing protein [Lachnospiraceae bacterium]